MVGLKLMTPRSKDQESHATMDSEKQTEGFRGEGGGRMG